MEYNPFIDITNLNLSRYNLDEIPESISKLKNLRAIIADNNNLTSIPECIGDLKIFIL